MKKKSILWLFLACLPLFAMAQQPNSSDQNDVHQPCGHDKCLAKAKAANPAVAEILQQNNQAIAAWIAQRRAALASGAEKSQAVIAVPVVVHLVYQNAAETLTDAEVVQMVKDMSTDFRHLNSDAGNAPQPFQNVAADVEVEFCLAKRDPQGLPTNGITRTLTNVQFFTLADEIKYSAQGGKDAWNTAKYLNIWIGKLQDGLNGYASLPGTVAANADGVAISTNAFENPEYQGKGHRIAVHETGHWFNLEHVFGYSPCDGIGDMVDDTPIQLTPTLGVCPTEYPYLPASDIQLAQMLEDLLGFPCSFDQEGHMYSNYMDYSNPVCMNLFTQGQKERVLAALNTQRTGLLSSDGCTPPTNLPTLEAALETLLSPLGEVCAGSVTASVYIRNLGQNTLKTMAFNVLVNGQASTFNWTGSLPTGEAAVIEIPNAGTANPGSNNVSVTIASVNGATDGNASNNQKSGSFTVYNGGYVPSVTEGFEGNVFPPNGWQLTSSAGNFPATQWERSTAASATGSASMKGNNYGSPAILFGPEYNYIYLPRIDLAGATNPVLSFDLAYKITYFANADYSKIYPGSGGDVFAVEISTDCGHTFQPIFSPTDAEMATVADTVVVPDNQPAPPLDEHSVTQADFKTFQFGLSDFIGEKVIIRFLNVGYSQPIYVDNINLESSQALTANFNALTPKAICTGSSVNFDFTGFGATSYSWTFEGGTPATSTQENPSITYLQPGAYDVTLSVSNGAGQQNVTKQEFITVLPQPTAVITQNNGASSPSANDGSIRIEVFGGVAPYTYTLQPGNQTSGNGAFDNLPAGDYTVTASSAGTGCSVSIPVTVSVVSGTAEAEQLLSKIGIVPNPNNGQFEVRFSQPLPEATELSLLDVTGRLLKTKQVLANSVYQETWELPGLPAGMYFLRIKMAGEVGAKKVVVK